MDRGAERRRLLAAFGMEDGIGSRSAGRSSGREGEVVELVDPGEGVAWTGYADAGPAVVERAMEAAAEGLQGVVGAHRLRARPRHVAGGAGGPRPAGRSRHAGDLTAGKPIRDTTPMVLKVAEMFEYYAGGATSSRPRHPGPDHASELHRPEPFAPSSSSPLERADLHRRWQIAPAIAAGNAVVLKPSELTPATSLALALVLEEAGLPAGHRQRAGRARPTTGEAAVTHPSTRSSSSWARPGRER
jgi:acyl-CoA reductase-like NAD-dependent aldehyde dehydrogenase